MMRGLLLLFFYLYADSVFGHARNNAFIDLMYTPGRLIGTLQLRLEDLPLITAIDTDHNRQLTWGEVKQSRPAISDYVTRHLYIDSENDPCAFAVGEFQLQEVGGAKYLFMPLEASCPLMLPVEISYSLLFEEDAAHRGLMKFETVTKPIVFVFAPDQQSFSIAAGEPSTLPYMQTFVEEGVWHIWTGYDHLLFLFALLIPLFGTRELSADKRGNTFKPVVIKVLKLVTAFTIAHSLTLILTSIYQPDFAAALLETVIALSVVLAGVNILRPMFDKGQWRIAFVFGLLHGLGFASALSGLVLPAEYFVECLLSFNLGVELGQLAIVLPCIPLLLWLSRQSYYRAFTMPGLALAVISCSLWWTVERAMQI